MPYTDAPRPAERSWWLEEALALPEFAGPEAPTLDGDTTADVLILGGGYTGLWTAWFLKERQPDLDVVLLESDICGGRSERPQRRVLRRVVGEDPRRPRDLRGR